MDISKMTDQEKSVLLARCMGWKDNDNPQYPLIQTPEGNNISSLYAPANMALAWRVLNWACFNEGISMYLDYNSNPQSDYPMHILMAFLDEQEIVIKPPAEAQRLWLDKILELDAGIIETPGKIDMGQVEASDLGWNDPGIIREE